MRISLCRVEDRIQVHISPPASDLHSRRLLIWLGRVGRLPLVLALAPEYLEGPFLPPADPLLLYFCLVDGRCGGTYGAKTKLWVDGIIIFFIRIEVVRVEMLSEERRHDVKRTKKPPLVDLGLDNAEGSRKYGSQRRLLQGVPRYRAGRAVRVRPSSTTVVARRVYSAWAAESSLRATSWCGRGGLRRIAKHD